MRFRVAGAICLSWAVTWLGCGSDDEGSSAVFDVSRYARNCSIAADCVVVFSGDPCSCSCEQAAVALSEQSRIAEDRRAYIAAQCPSGPPDCGACGMQPTAECRDNRCELVP